MKDKPKDPTKVLNTYVPPTESQPQRVELRDLLMDYDPSVLRLWLEEQEQAERDQELPEQGGLK
jgi:hypothetical protein